MGPSAWSNPGTGLFACFPPPSVPPREPLFPASHFPVVAAPLVAQIANTAAGHDRLTVAIQRSPESPIGLCPRPGAFSLHPHHFSLCSSLPPPPRSLPFDQAFFPRTLSPATHKLLSPHPFNIPPPSSYPFFFSSFPPPLLLFSQTPSSFLLPPPPLSLSSSFLGQHSTSCSLPFFFSFPFPYCLSIPVLSFPSFGTSPPRLLIKDCLHHTTITNTTTITRYHTILPS